MKLLRYGPKGQEKPGLLDKDGQISQAFCGFSKRDLEAVGERAGVKPFRPGDDVPDWKAG